MVQGPSTSSTRDCSEVDPTELEWQLAKHLLDAHTYTGAALEQYLMLQTFREEELGDSQEICNAIEQAVLKHQDIIAELEAAYETLNTLENQDS